MKPFAPSKTLQSLFAAVVAGLSLVASGGLAEDVVFEGGTTNWVDGDLVITYADPTVVGKLSLPKTATARILAVGGGGGGGRVTKTVSSVGGGGGGGGGGVVIANGLTLNGEYTITVGGGGAAGAGGTSVSNPGATGGDTSLKQADVDVITVAKGGGGGGAESDGLPGGSGGGGSMMTGRIEKSGGSGVDGQGHAGGSGVQTRGGAGGGGAGAIGVSPTSTSSGANGGDGVSCDITGSSRFYGGGGGAGNFYYSMTGLSLGGKGGGGKGLGGRSTSVSADEAALVNGTDGLGGGGGGGGTHETAVAGRGGNGVLIVRITSYLDAGVTPPAIRSDLVFTGEPQTAGEPDDPNRAFYSVTAGQDTATDAGDYSFTLTLNEGLEWTDGTTEPKSFSWSIAPKVVSVPKAREGLVYDGTEQVGVTNDVPSDAAFYEVTGGSAINAGAYAFTATLKYAATNVRWADAAAQVVDVPWSIARKVVAVPTVTTSFTYEPGQLRIALPESDDYTRTGTPEAMDAGNYTCAAVLKNTAEAVNYEWSTGSTGALPYSWTIAKATNSIEGLRLADWQVGATANEPSVTRVVNGSVAAIVYSYRAQTETAWSLAKPTAAGWYVVRATLAETTNWSEAVAETAFCVWKNPSVEYTYFVDVTNAASAGAGVDVTISEASLPGFLYDCTDGLKDGAFRFVYSRTADPIDDILLAYSNLTWNVAGESTMRVRLPDGVTRASPIRMYWHARVAEPLSRNDPGAASGLSMGTAATGYGLVNSNGVWINYWTQEPSLSKTTWDESETPGVITPGALKVGSVKTTYRKLPRGAETETMPLTRGSYAAILTMADMGADYALDGGARQLQYEILGHSSVAALGGTASGRILLVNDDTGGNGREAITDQGYWQTADTGHPIYWTHTGTHGVRSAFPFVRQGISHTLYRTTDDGAVVALWRIENGMIGNVFRSGPRANADSNYLPWSPTSKAISAEGATFPASTTANGEVGNIIFRNTTDAAVYSPFYTNGVGVVYFDAVNSYTGNADGFKLVVEIATETATGLVPTDENCRGDDERGDEDPYYNLRGRWKPVAILPLVKDGTDEFVAQTRRTELDLLGFSGNGKADRFVRGCAEVNVRGPVRFRIRRSSVVVGTSGAAQAIDSYQSLLLLDNIIASPPAMYTDLAPFGHYDERKVGKQTLGQECALSIPFPSIFDTEVYARAKAQNVTTPDLPIDNTNFVASARLNYRWRYLNQRFSPARVEDEDRWESVFLDPEDGYRSIEPLKYPAAEGDIEFFYDLTLQAPFYAYQDYSGCGAAKPTGDYTEEIRHWTNRMDLTVLESTRLASGGANWFVRLRNGTSNWASMRLVLEGGTGAVAGEYDMELTGDNTWRTLVLVPTNAEGVVSFHFEGFNELAAGATEIPADPEAVRWGVISSGTNAVPATGKLVLRGANDGLVPLDHVANYLEFKLNDRFATYAITRAEYQDFNHWNDAARDKTFKINYVETNSVDYAAMQTYKSDFSDWQLYAATNANWNETFSLADYTDPAYPKESLYQRTATPNGWTAQNVSWVFENLVTSNDVAKSGGMAAKLLGQGGGVIDFTNVNTPSGLDRITFRTHIGQSMTFDSFSYSVAALMDDNYTFHAPLSMSRDCHSNGERIGDMAVGASVSLVAYYYPHVGCYELRLSRPYRGKTILLELYKWTYRGQASVSERLCYTYADASLWMSDADERSGTDTEIKRNKYYGAFISCGDRGGGTEIICGVATDPQKLNPTRPSSGFSGQSHVGLIYTDTDNPHLYGSYGVAAKDCPAQFVMPSYSALPLQDAVNVRAAVGAKDHFGKDTDGQTTIDINLTANDLQPVSDDIPTRKWAKVPGRAECFTNTTAGLLWSGLRTPTNLTQNLEVWLSPKGRQRWTRFAEVPVSGYAFVNTSSVLIHQTGMYDVRFKTADDQAVDVVIDDIIQYQWQAPNIEDAKFYEQGNYIYTQGIVQENVGARTREVLLQPSRAIAEEPVSLRSPLLSGLGKIAFTYRAADANAQIWVQVATNDVSRNLNTYNLSVVEGEGVGQWKTIRKYGPASAGFTGDDVLTTGGTGTKVIYLGWHNNDDRPIRGVFRLFVPTNVVKAAVARATVKDSTDLDYGRITITGMTVTDEPGLSERSWRGWNMRTIGDETDSERRMYLSDMTLADGEGYGLVCGLNNGIWPGDLETADDEVRLRSGFPAVYSPTFKSPEGERRGIGTVTYRARLYEDAAQNGGGQIVGYGSTDPLRGVWVPIFTNVVTRSVFSNFTWSAGTETYYSIKLEVSSASLVSSVRPEAASVDRVILDEVFVSEKVQPTLAFVYARPFRNNLMSTDPIGDILSANEQPLAGESWGVQAQLSLQQLADEVDLSRGMKVALSYYPQATPWGYNNWKDLAGATRDVELTQVGESTNLIFRSVGTSPRELVAPATEAGTIVQFMLKVTYYDHGGKAYETLMSSWAQPSWYHPVDLNGTGSGGYNSEDFSKYSAYTILDSVSPGRAWINEVNWNDGTAEESGEGRNKCVTNQFIEICVPSGADMAGWRVRLTDMNNHQFYMARFGSGLAATKTSSNATNGYEFVVIQSPATRDAGGMKDAAGRSVADGTWGSDFLDKGTLNYGEPYQFELIRPSGVIEHQFVLSGTNEWSDYVFGGIYDGTNLLATLNATNASPLRFYAGDELARRTDGRLFGSAGVIGGSANGNPAPGAAATWKSGLTFTPGHLNEGQIIPEDWLIHPNGTNAWVYLSVVGDHLSQVVEGETNRSAVVVVPQGSRTNVTYVAAPWYEMAALTVNGVTNAVNKPGVWTYTFAPTGTTYVIATEGPDHVLKNEFDLGDDNVYTPAVLNWLRENWPDKSPNDIQLARYKGLGEDDREGDLTLTHMYWLDIPAVTDSGTREWLLRGGMSGIEGEAHVIRRNYGGRDYTLTNRIVEVKLYLTNEVTGTVYAPERLQGVNNERSDTYTGGNWTSVTFKVRAQLNVNTNGANRGYLPLSSFTFGPGSFGPRGAANEFTSRIELIDPFSPASLGYSYGWGNHSNTNSFWFKWSIDTDLVPIAVPVLKALDVYDSTP